MYRDDESAARARLESLQVALRVAQLELAAASGPDACSVRGHAALAVRLVELEKLIATQRDQLGSSPSPHPRKEEELTRLRLQLSDLELLASGTEAMEQKLAECERAIEALTSARDPNASLTVRTALPDEDWVWAPRRGVLRRTTRWLTTLGATIAGAAIAMAAGPGAIAVGGVLLAVGGALLGVRKQNEDELVAAQVNAIAVAGVRWANVERIRFERDPVRIVLELPGSRRFVLHATNLGYARVVEYARNAVELYGIPTVGDVPKLLAGAT